MASLRWFGVVMAGFLLCAVAPGSALVPLWTRAGDAAVSDIAISADGQSVALAAGKIFLLGSNGSVTWSGFHGQTVALSSDGLNCAAGTDLGVTYLYHDGTVLWSAQGYTPIRALVMSPDGTRVLAAGKEYLVQYMNTASVHIEREEPDADCIAMAPDGGLVAVGTRYMLEVLDGSGSVLWNRTTGAAIGAVAVGQTDDGYVVAAAGAGTLVLYDRQGRGIWNHTNEGEVIAIALSDDASALAVGRGGGRLSLFARNGFLLWERQVDGEITAVGVDAGASFIAAGTDRGDLLLFNRSGYPLGRFHADGGITRVALAAGGGFLAAGTGKGCVYCFGTGGEARSADPSAAAPAEAAEWEPRWTSATTAAVRGIAIPADGQYIAVASDRTYVFERSGEKYAGSWHADSIAITDDGSRVVAGTDFGLQCSSPDGIVLWEDSENAPQAVSMTPYGDAVVAVLSDSVVKYNFTGSRIFTTVLSFVHAAAVSKNGDQVVVGTRDTVVSLKDDGVEWWRYPTSADVWSVAVGQQDGTIFAAADNTLLCFHPNGELLWKEHTGDRITALAITPDATRVAVGSRDTCIYVFSQGGDLLWKYTTGDWVESVSLSADGMVAAAGSMDRHLYLFDGNGDLLGRYRADAWVTSVAVVPDGSGCAAGTAGGRVLYFDMPSPALPVPDTPLAPAVTATPLPVPAPREVTPATTVTPVRKSPAPLAGGILVVTAWGMRVYRRTRPRPQVHPVNRRR